MQSWTNKMYFLWDAEVVIKSFDYVYLALVLDKILL